jgi:hypothetical protein
VWPLSGIHEFLVIDFLLEDFKAFPDFKVFPDLKPFPDFKANV